MKLVDLVPLKEGSAQAEKSWNSIDVSRKAEKEIGNREWNERTTKKLDMLIALNKAGKFKKDFDEERLQGWVDQNYSWEKLSRQFKLNESYNISNVMNVSSMSEDMDGPDEGFPMSQRPTYGQEYEPEDMDNPDEDLVIIGSGYLDIKSNFGERPSQTNGEYATLGQKVVDKLHNGDKEAALDYIYSKINEGSCGYGPNGVPGDTPGETRGMPADKRTMTMMREAIRKEIKKLNEKEGVKHYTKDGKEWKGATHKMPNGKLMTQDPHRKDSEELFHKEDLKETSLDDKLRGALGDKDFEKATSRKVPGFADIKPKEKKSKFKKAGEKSGFDMRGLK